MLLSGSRRGVKTLEKKQFMYGEDWLRMNPKILTWNVRGLGSLERQAAVHKVIVDYKANLVVLQETKMEVISTELIETVWGNVSLGWEFIPSIGLFDGVLCLWDPKIFRVEDKKIGGVSISLLLRNIRDDFAWCFTGVYRPNDYRI
ncbi:hypothetical protein BVC80_8831g21 [Macleaya cordata]|uniref:Endonuclease/exonuclease/phosphatase n=1 Tax=Macleaya cordata TaxID=56857 RepID=A0A200RE44_MACCD|nr:hypothetical protein BVC80_8831g21 [Macleaya cordata]